MDFYLMTLSAIQKLLADIDKKEYAYVVGECIENWKNKGDSTMFGKEFDKNGRFADFRLDSTSISDFEKGFWTGQVFSALVAMAAQLAFFHQKGMKADIAFLRKNFGAANEVMTVSKCADCGRREATLLNIDKYVSKIVIAKKIVDGMEKNELDSQIERLITVSAPEIERERRKTRTRLENSSIPYIETYGTIKSCLKCGSKNIAEGRLLRSVKENIFVPLNH